MDNLKKDSIELKFEKVNGTKNDVETIGFILCGGDDVCSWQDGICNPKYH